MNDEFFKDKIDYLNQEDNIYTQFAKTMARNADIDLAKTPLVDILTGYTRYRTSEERLENIEKYIRKYNKKCISQNTMLVLNDILLIKNGLGEEVVRLEEENENG